MTVAESLPTGGVGHEGAAPQSQLLQFVVFDGGTGAAYERTRGLLWSAYEAAVADPYGDAGVALSGAECEALDLLTRAHGGAVPTEVFHRNGVMDVAHVVMSLRRRLGTLPKTRCPRIAYVVGRGYRLTGVVYRVHRIPADPWQALGEAETGAAQEGAQPP